MLRVRDGWTVRGWKPKRWTFPGWTPSRWRWRDGHVGRYGPRTQEHKATSLPHFMRRLLREDGQTDGGEGRDGENKLMIEWRRGGLRRWWWLLLLLTLIFISRLLLSLFFFYPWFTKTRNAPDKAIQGTEAAKKKQQQQQTVRKIIPISVERDCLLLLWLIYNH